MKEKNSYKSIPLQKIKIEDVSIGLRQIGTGEDLVFIHGFPTHGYTWRKIIPELSKQFTCHILDLPGLGDSEWTDKTDFQSNAQARYVIQLLEKLGIEKYSLIAHNSGATVARAIAIKEKVENLIMLNTEIPNHRPPWIPFYQKVDLWPFVSTVIRQLLKQPWFIKSPMGLKEAYSDKLMLTKDSNLLPYTEPLINSNEKSIGAFKYLKGIDWKLIDEFKKLHGQIKANTLLIWGEDDKTFPIKYARKMVEQFNSAIELVSIKNASLLPHEEKPDEVVEAILQFVKPHRKNNTSIR